MSDRAVAHTHMFCFYLIIRGFDPTGPLHRVFIQLVFPLSVSSLSLLPCSSKNPTFKEVLTRIEGHPDCRNLPMISFLILPMQRITRLPLLMDVSALKAQGSSSFGMTKLRLLRNSLFICAALTKSTQCVLTFKYVSLTLHKSLILIFLTDL